MISVDGLTVEFGDRALFKDISFQINEKDRIALMGKNGAGKSTLLKILAGQRKPSRGNVSAPKDTVIAYLPQHLMTEDGRTVYEEASQAFAPLFAMEKRIDDLNRQLTERTDYDSPEYYKLIEEVSALSEKYYSIDLTHFEADVEKTLLGLGFKREDLQRQTSDFSGGWRMRIELAKMLLKNPDVLLLDEPTNHLDIDSIQWLEEFLINFENTVIVVSHDRYFLNKVCTHTADIDYGKIQLYAGNYDFWYESSQLMIRQMKEANKKKEEKIKELQDFISRFSANASKSKQATSRKRALEKIQLDEIRPSSRKYPYIDFRPEREIGNEVLMVENLSKTIDGVKVLDDISFTLGRNDKVAFVGGNELAKTVFFKILMGEMEPDEGSFKWGVTTSQAYFPKDSTKEFDNDLTIVDWLTQFSEIKDATYVRGFLGRMLFAGDDGVKQVRVLSGGEKVRCLLSKMMISGANILIFDEPTNHLDMESITALNNGMIKFPGVILFASHDHQIVQTTANRIMEILPNGKLIDKITSYDEYLASDEMAKKRQVYSTEGTLEDN